MHHSNDAANTVRSGMRHDVAACVSTWVSACAARDGHAFDGVAERARPKFDDAIVWLVAGDAEDVDGFVLVTAPGSGTTDDPIDAAVVGLLAVRPDRQARGLGRALLLAAQQQLVHLGHERAVLHTLDDNAAALRLYESEGWRPYGDPFEHTLLKRPARTYIRDLPGPAR
ncbi:GNAT family N-acetyltransferase [Herbiconiux daphne]|uniref:GNAT family N-acetyltransferase n=1 Tax=Herbiconiux daphne TaxID=2970914 RepID=A0ABT2GWJ0_9MICO|nr:GNAT family N-acetyltransferase [Herbiconiux daphne]MCS5732318.1 GNAT family N-acetyltransferase [Herbiconiux daphne]